MKKNKIKELEAKIKHYEQITAAALVDYQNSCILEERKKEAVKAIMELESQNRQLAQEYRRKEELINGKIKVHDDKRTVIIEQLEAVKGKLLNRWKEMFKR